MLIGRKIRNLAGWPVLRLKADQEKCTTCDPCTRGCPMSLPVREKVEAGKMKHSECVLCASCVDYCNRNVIQVGFGSGRE